MMRFNFQSAVRILSTLLLLNAVSTAFAVERISGVVTSVATGNPINLVDLDVFDSNGASVSITGGTSGAGGVYTLTLPGPGTYTIRADSSRAGGRVDQYYDHAFLPSLATPITVTTGQTVSGIDFDLDNGVEIQGTIRSAANNQPIAGVDLDLYGSTGEFLSGYSATSAADGSYGFGALPAGTYFLRADPDPGIGQFFVKAYYDGEFLLSTATPIIVGANTVTGIDLNLAPGGLIAGTVTETGTNTPLVDIDIDLYDALGNEMPQNDATDASGAYSIGPVPPGNYFVRVDPDVTQGHPRQYYNGVYTRAESTAVVVAAGQTTSNIQFSLPRAGTISGSVRHLGSNAALADIDLDCYDALGNTVEVSAKSDVNGAYVIGPLLPGSYTLRADPTPLQGLSRQYFSQQIAPSTATTITVTASNNTPNIDFLLADGGTISGVITDASSGLPVQGVDLDVLQAGTFVRLVQNTISGVDGAYQLTNIPPGDYVVRADPALLSGFQRTYFGGALTQELATVVTVAAGQDLTDISIELSLPAEGQPEGVAEGVSEGVSEGVLEGTPEGVVEGIVEGTPEGVVEGIVEGVVEGVVEGTPEGVVEGVTEGVVEGVVEGLTEGEGQAAPVHSADQNGDNVMNLSEVIRVIAFYNSTGLHCQAGSEDGYAPGPLGDKSCAPHSSDYSPQDWTISLSELLRLVQLYNIGSIHPCPNSEDGFCLGPGV